MDIDRTEAIVARMRRDGWEITPNAYIRGFAGLYVVAERDTGFVYITKSSPAVNLTLADQIAAYLSALPGLTDVAVGPQDPGGRIRVTFGCADFGGYWTA